MHPLLLGAMRDRILRRWLEIDAEDALVFAESSSGGYVAADLVRVWVDMDQESALDALAQASPGLLAKVRWQFASHLAQIDPRRALTALDRIPFVGTASDSDEMAAGVYRIWAETDPEAAAKAVTDSVSKWGERSPLQLVAKTWAASDPQAAWDFFTTWQPDKGELDANDFIRAAEQIIPYLLEKNPEFDFSDAVTSSDFFDGKNSSRVASAWARRNPKSAISFAQTRPQNDSFARALLVQVATGLATAEPERALELFESIDGSEREYENRGVARQAFASLASSGVEESFERWHRFPDKFKTDALSGIMTYQIAADSTAALADWKTWLTDDKIASSVFPAMEIALSWGHGGGVQDISSVVEAIPEFGAHVSGYVLDSWVRSAPEAAAAFMAAEIRSGRDFDEDDMQAVAELSHARPEYTAEWVAELPNGQIQNDAAATLAVNWSRLDPAAAAEWIADLPEGDVFNSVASALEMAESQLARRRR